MLKRPLKVNSYRLVLVILALTTCLSCAPGLRVPGITPAGVGWEGIRDIALLKFDGQYGETVRHHIHNRLADVRYFNSLDTAAYPVLDEISYDMVEGAKALYITGDLHADLVIGARVTGAVNDTHGTDQVQVEEGTGYYKKEKNIHGQWVEVEIKRTVIRSLPYVIRQASLTIDYRVFEMDTGRIAAAGAFEENYNDKIGGDKWHASTNHKPGEIPTPAATIDEFSAKIATRLVAKLSRMKVADLVKFDKSGNRKVRRGVALARDGDWEDAIELWQEEISSEPTSAAALYNLGVAHESIGDLENLRTAIDLYEKAAGYGDNTLYADAIARVQRMIQQSDNQKRF
jgi:tetratricopeptide (TPR) repeat protein